MTVFLVVRFSAFQFFSGLEITTLNCSPSTSLTNSILGNACKARKMPYNVPRALRTCRSPSRRLGQWQFHKARVSKGFSFFRQLVVIVL
jgi:hypothetical protein